MQNSIKFPCSAPLSASATKVDDINYSPPFRPAGTIAIPLDMAGVTEEQVKVSGLVLSILSVLVAVWRLGYRCYLKRMWWDDVPVAFAAMVQLLQLIFTQIRYDPRT